MEDSRHWSRGAALAALIVSLTCSFAAPAGAQDEPVTEPATDGEAAPSGSEEAVAEPEPEPEPEPESSPAPPPPSASAQFGETVAAAPAADRDPLVWNFALGSTLNYGNARAFALSAGTHFEYFAQDPTSFDHLLTADVLFSYGIASLRDETLAARPWMDWAANAQNLLAKVRYDFFVTDDDAIFAALWFRNDPFAGLEFRFQGQLGYARTFFREGDSNQHRFWGEVGLDLTYDDRLVPPTATFANSEERLSGRLFVGYDNHLNDNWQLLTGVEVLLPFLPEDAFNPPPSTVEFQNNYDLRVSSISELRFKIEDNLQFGLRFTLLFDNRPVPGNEQFDTTTVLNVVYTAL